MSELPDTQNITATVVTSNVETQISNTFIKQLWSLVDKIKSNKLYLGLTIVLLLSIVYILYKKYAKSKKQPVIIDNDQLQQQLQEEMIAQQIPQQVQQQVVPQQVQQQVVPQQVQQQVVPQQVQQQVVPQQVQQQVVPQQVQQQQLEKSPEEIVINKKKKLKKVDSNVKI